MRKFNILVEPKSIRNTITRDSPVITPRRSVGRKLATLAISLLITAGVGAVGIPLLLEKTGGPKINLWPLLSDFMHVPDKSPVSQNEELSDSDLLVDIYEPAPDELPMSSRQEAEIENSLPIAGKAAPPPMVEKVIEDIKVWRVRFGLCLMKESCEKISERLREKGIITQLVTGVLPITTYRVIIGPFGTGSHAKQAGLRLAQLGYNTTLFTSESQHFLSTKPYDKKEDSTTILRKVRSLGYEALESSRIERQTVFKVYKGAYKTASEALKERSRFKNKGIECIVEQAG